MYHAHDYFQFHSYISIAKISLIFRDYKCAERELLEAMKFANRKGMPMEYRSMIFRLLNWVRVAKTA